MATDFRDLIIDEFGYIPFHARCPKGDHTIQRHRPEDWRTGLANGQLLFHCATCGESWSPSLNDKATVLSRIGR